MTRLSRRDTRDAINVLLAAQSAPSTLTAGERQAISQIHAISAGDVTPEHASLTFPVLTCAGSWDAPHDELRVTTRMATQFCTCGLSLHRDEMTQRQILAADTV